MLLDLLPRRCVLHQQVGDTMLMVIDFEQISQSWFSDIQAHQEYFLAQKREGDCKVGGDKRLTLTGSRGCEHDDLLIVFEHKLQVGTHRTEDLLHLIVAILVDDDLTFGLGRLCGDSHISDDRERCQLSDILVTLNLVAEELEQEDDECRQS